MDELCKHTLATFFATQFFYWAESKWAQGAIIAIFQGSSNPSVHDDIDTKSGE